MKPEGTRYRAITQVKVLSPETIVVPIAEAVEAAAGSILITVSRNRGSSLYSWYMKREPAVNSLSLVYERGCRA